jgi:hypothetical protein
MRHLERLGITDSPVTPDPGARRLRGGAVEAVNAHGFLCAAVVVSDDAG